ncbi:MAG: DUF362 domain-containing protein, partial [Verrucomicrobia bacterium]|nr:DUF362 domain-containing protein [Verrucomicrobiota bacterium]
MRLLLALLLGLACALVTRAAAPTSPARAAEPVWEALLARFDEATYETQVERLIAAYEQTSGRRLAPGAKRKAGIKIYADSGPGLATPLPLVKAVISALRRRGFDNGDIFLVGLNALRLRMTGYLPSLVS